MKGLAIILTACLLLLNVENLMENFQLSGETVAMECCSDNCSGCCDAEGEHHEGQAPCEPDQDCAPGCDCSSQFQLTALVYSFMESSGATVQSYLYVRYMNTYSFEYSDDFLQPPRFS